MLIRRITTAGLACDEARPLNIAVVATCITSGRNVDEAAVVLYYTCERPAPIMVNRANVKVKRVYYNQCEEYSYTTAEDHKTKPS